MLKRFLGLNTLLVFIPIALIGRIAGINDALLFLFSALAIVPLAGLIGSATETVAERTGPQIGGLLNATLGNAAELIITVLALQKGLPELVRASIVGSVIGNILLVMGASMVIGGLKHGTQKFNPRTASINATLMILAFVTIAIPSFFDPAVLNGAKTPQSIQRETIFTVGIAVVMIVLYVLSIIFTLRTKPPASGDDAGGAVQGPAHGGTGDPITVTPQMLRMAILTLALATLTIVVMSELLVGTVEHVVTELGLSELFVGIIVVPIIGNVAEHFVAIQVALKNRMDLSVGISIGSSLQIGLFVTPVLVFISLLFPTPLLLVFNRYELIALAIASAVAMLVSQDGESNWLEGAELLAVYLMIGLAFFVIPTALH
jgi:Ca2+:H+ antiporter